jgi:putative transposase
MAQLQCVVALGRPHHITQSGNFRRDVFYDDEDRSAYLALLARYSCEAQLQILGYCSPETTLSMTVRRVW